MTDRESFAHVTGPELTLEDLRWPMDYPSFDKAEKIALVFERREMSYGELDRLSSAFSGLIEQLGILRGACIAYLGRNSDIYFPVLFGTMRAQLVLLPLNWRCTASELSFIIADANAEMVICDREFRDLAAASLPTIDILEIEGENGLRARLATAPMAVARPADPDAPAMLMYTSGTTGKPKGVVITQRMYALARHAELISPDYANWKSDDIVLSSMPNFHMGGLSWLLGAFRRGLTAVLTSDLTAKGLLQLCVGHGISRTFIVPTVLRAILDEMRVQGVKLPALKEIQYGASPMDEALLTQAVSEIGCQFLHHYGMTENAGTATRLGPLDHDLDRPHLLRSVGKPQPGLELEIRHPDRSICLRDEHGEIWIRSPTLMAGYWLRPDATAEAIKDGWYCTGDGGYLDREGFLFLTDRIKDIIISGGENIYPAEVENAIKIHPAILDTAVFGQVDPTWGEIVVAAIEVRSGATVTESDLRTFLRGHIAGYKIPKRFLFDQVLPRTATGKVQRAKVQKRLSLP